MKAGVCVCLGSTSPGPGTGPVTQQELERCLVVAVLTQRLREREQEGPRAQLLEVEVREGCTLVEFNTHCRPLKKEIFQVNPPFVFFH